MEKRPRILIYGMGAIGSLFAGKLAHAGYRLTVLARGKRLEELGKEGIVLKHALTGEMIRTRDFELIEDLKPDDIYDYVIVAVQNTQIDDILPILGRNRSKAFVFVVNNPMGYRIWVEAVGSDRLMIGFPSAGGERKDGVVNYFVGTGMVKLFQSTTFGELNGRKTERLKSLVDMFKKAGFSPAICPDMDRWQKTHVAVILPISKALYRFGSDNYRLSASGATLKQMILATRECFHVLRRLGIKITPFKLNFYYLPTALLVPVYRLVMNSKVAEYAMAKHTVVARQEIEALEGQFRQLILESGEKTPALDTLER